MITVTLDKVRTEIPYLIEKVLGGEEFVVTDHNEPVMKISPIRHYDEYMKKMRELYELPEPKPLSSEEYKKQIRALRGMAKGIDTTVEREEDRI